jgi:hypothetical protein
MNKMLTRDVGATLAVARHRLMVTRDVGATLAVNTSHLRKFARQTMPIRKLKLIGFISALWDKNPLSEMY